MPASTLFDGADTRSPFTVPPLVRARRGNSIVSASITAGPFTLTVPVLPNEPFGTVAIKPPVIVALPRSTLPEFEATVRPLDTVTVENVRLSAALTSADAAASEMGCVKVLAGLFKLTAPLGAVSVEACATCSGPDCVMLPDPAVADSEPPTVDVPRLIAPLAAVVRLPLVFILPKVKPLRSARATEPDTGCDTCPTTG